MPHFSPAHCPIPPPPHPTFSIDKVRPAATCSSSAEGRVAQGRAPTMQACTHARTSPRAGHTGHAAGGCRRHRGRHHASNVGAGLECWSPAQTRKTHARLHASARPRLLPTPSCRGSCATQTQTHPWTRPCSVSPSTQATGTFLAKSAGTLAGLGIADLVFQQVDPTVQVCMGSVERVHAGRGGQLRPAACSTLAKATV